jgi:hypothetical protein
MLDDKKFADVDAKVFGKFCLENCGVKKRD